MADGRMPQSTLTAHQEAAFRLSQALQSQQVPHPGVLSPPTNDDGHYGLPETKTAQPPGHFSPLTNSGLRFNAQGRRNVEQQPPRRAFDEVGQPGPGVHGLGRPGEGGAAGLAGSASAGRRARQVATTRFDNADVSGGAGEISPEPLGSHASAFQPVRNASTHFSRPDHANSAAKQSGHLKINPLMVQSNRTSHVDSRVSGLNAARADEGSKGTADPKPHANIFTSIDEYKPPQIHKTGAHMSEQKRPVIKKDNILFSGGSSVPTFPSKQSAPQGPHVPAMIINGVARRPSDQQVGRGRQGGGNN